MELVTRFFTIIGLEVVCMALISTMHTTYRRSIKRVSFPFKLMPPLRAFYLELIMFFIGISMHFPLQQAEKL